MERTDTETESWGGAAVGGRRGVLIDRSRESGSIPIFRWTKIEWCDHKSYMIDAGIQSEDHLSLVVLERIEPGKMRTDTMCCRSSQLCSRR